MNVVLEALYITVAFLLSETEDMELLRDSDMLERLNDINNLPKEDKEEIKFVFDGKPGMVKPDWLINNN